MKLPECRYLHGFLAFPLPDFYRMCYNEYTKSIGVHMNNREIVSCFFINGYTLQNYDFRFIKALCIVCSFKARGAAYTRG